jgi:GR25 family glycosyltransferase involved in LPS biosynthesis
MNDPDSKYPSSWRKGQTTGGIASGLSHIDTTSLLTTSPSWRPGDYILILEDDCVLTGDIVRTWDLFLTFIFDANKYVPDWDMLMLGAAGHRPDICPSKPIEGSSTIEFAGFSYLTTMYFISERGVKKLEAFRPLCLGNMLAFDELHNALANLSGRKDVCAKFFPRESKNYFPLVLLSSIQSLVRQDPFDGVHDTEVSAGNRTDSNRVFRSSTDDDPKLGDELIAYPMDVPIAGSDWDCIYWWRRTGPHPVSRETLNLQFSGTTSSSSSSSSKKRQSITRVGMLSFLMKHFEDQSVPQKRSFPSSFDFFEKNLTTVRE